MYYYPNKSCCAKFKESNKLTTTSYSIINKVFGMHLVLAMQEDCIEHTASFIVDIEKIAT